MRTQLKTTGKAKIGFLAIMSMAIAGPAGAAAQISFSDPGVALSGEAVIASGTCIAKYATKLEDVSQPAATIGHRVALRCAREISRSAGLATWMTGRPEDFPKNLRYVQEDLTTNTVLRYRSAAVKRSRIE